MEGWDYSFKQIAIIMATEERFNIEFGSRDLDRIRYGRLGQADLRAGLTMVLPASGLPQVSDAPNAGIADPTTRPGV